MLPGSGYKSCVLDQGPCFALLHGVEMDELSELQLVRGRQDKAQKKTWNRAATPLGLVQVCEHVCRGASLKNSCLNT